MTITINIPTSGNSNNQIPIEIDNKLVLIGANGAGKSRLGAWLEKTYGEQAVRVTAQKSLEIPDNFVMTSTHNAYTKLRYGHEGLTLLHREGSLYNGKPTGSTVRDFEGLLQLLFARDSEAAKKVRTAANANVYDANKPIKSDLEKVKEIWERILPHRIINTNLEGQLKTAKKDGVAPVESSEYLAGQMSDGERVAFYLLGKCLVAPENAILIIDEPELHLHPTIRDSLWGALEAERRDCTFIYITHDIDFALSRMEDQAIWLQAFDGTNWTWEIVKRDAELPEGLHLELLGSRRPVLFVEGTKGKLDERLYSALYPQFLVHPCGNCTQVIQYVRAARNLNSFHHIAPMAIIDADNRTDAEKESLKNEGIYTLNCVEVENLLWAPEVLDVMAELEGKPDANGLATERIISEVQKLLEQTVVAKVAMKVQSTIQWSKNSTLDAIKTDLQNISAFDVEAEANTFRDKIKEALAVKNLCDLMQLVEHKFLHRLIAEDFGLKAERYAEKIINNLTSNDPNLREKMFAAFKSYLPEIPLLRFTQGGSRAAPTASP
jgi:energy-coupling factor transporter ATP-binding protein EcfA2